MKCSTKRCKNKRKTNSNKCYTCISKVYRATNPEKACYRNLKSNSKRRGKEFNLTFQQFLEFCVRTNYMLGKGRSKEGYHIDRIDNDKGYTEDNIQVLTNSENLKKYITWVNDEKNKPTHFRFEAEQKTQTTDTPF